MLKAGRFNMSPETVEYNNSQPAHNDYDKKHSEYAEFMKKVYDIDIDEQNNNKSNNRFNTFTNDDDLNEINDDAKFEEYIKILKDMSDVEHRDMQDDSKPHTHQGINSQKHSHSASKRDYRSYMNRSNTRHTRTNDIQFNLRSTSDSDNHNDVDIEKNNREYKEYLNRLYDIDIDEYNRPNSQKNLKSTQSQSTIDEDEYEHLKMLESMQDDRLTNMDDEDYDSS